MTNDRRSPRAVQVLGRQAGGRQQLYIDKAALAETKAAELRRQLDAAGVEPALAAELVAALREACADGAGGDSLPAATGSASIH